MRISSRISVFCRLLAPPTLLALVLVISGCASTSARDGWLPTSQEAQQTTFGGWAEVSPRPGSSYQEVVQGELIAMEGDTVFILQGATLRTIDRRDIEHVRVFAYDTSLILIGSWTALAILSAPFAHGAIGLFSVPIWLGTGVLAGSRQSYAPVHTFPSDSWASLARFARFPQGLPDAVELSELRPKPGAFR